MYILPWASSYKTFFLTLTSKVWLGTRNLFKVTTTRHTMTKVLFPNLRSPRSLPSSVKAIGIVQPPLFQSRCKKKTPQDSTKDYYYGSDEVTFEHSHNDIAVTYSQIVRSKLSAGKMALINPAISMMSPPPKRGVAAQV